MMKDIMVDIETLGRRGGCIILSIGALQFDKSSGLTGEEFNVNIDPHAMGEAGFFVEKETAAWWKEQSEEAQNALKVDRLQPYEALSRFAAFFKKYGDKFWAQGSAFDAPILEHAFRVYGIECPWKFWNVRDTRTVYDVLGFDPKKVKRDGVYHSALDDCKHQFVCLREALIGRVL